MSGGVRIHQGDVLDTLSSVDSETYSACFSDPPYGLSGTPDMTEVLTHWLAGDDYKHGGGGFMGKSWDSFVPGPAVWREVLRVTKPGGVLLAFGGTRTWDLLSIALRLAGWEVNDTINYLHGGPLFWAYGSGFPKSHDISKAIDREVGEEREVVGHKSIAYPDSDCWGIPNKNTMGVTYTDNNAYGKDHRTQRDRKAITAPATDLARIWDGYGTALKPSFEPILLCRRPRTKTYAQHAAEDGTGALWVDGARIPTSGTTDSYQGRASQYSCGGDSRVDGRSGDKDREHRAVDFGGDWYRSKPDSQGRWPANLIHSGDPEVLEVFARAGERKSPATYQRTTSSCNKNTYGNGIGEPSGSLSLNYGDTGSVARFFYCAKASRRERNAGLEGMEERVSDVGDDRPGGTFNERLGKRRDGSERKKVARQNHHPTVKPLALTEYLARLILPPVEYRADARLLVPFAGVASEMIGAILAGWLNVDGIELEPEYIEIAERRIEHWRREAQMQPSLLEQV